MSLKDDYKRILVTPSDIQGHLHRFVELVDELAATHVIELGTRTGVSTIAWLYALEGKGTLTSVDIDPRPPLGEHAHWAFIQGDDLDPLVLSQMSRADVVFIDTTHHYDQTLAELEAYLPFVRPGGRILLHDTELRRPEGSPSRPLYPVRAAITTFTEAFGLEWHEEPGSWGLGIIKVPDGDN